MLLYCGNVALTKQISTTDKGTSRQHWVLCKLGVTSKHQPIVSRPEIGLYKK